MVLFYTGYQWRWHNFPYAVAGNRTYLVILGGSRYLRSLARAQSEIPAVTSASGNLAPLNGTHGYEFSVNSDIQVVALGLRDVGDNGLADVMAHQVSLWTSGGGTSGATSWCETAGHPTFGRAKKILDPQVAARVALSLQAKIEPKQSNHGPRAPSVLNQLPNPGQLQTKAEL